MVIKKEIGFQEALDLTLSMVPLMETEMITLDNRVSGALSQDIFAQVDSPSQDSSLRDGYAVLSGDLKEANDENPVELRVIGDSTAGKVQAIIVSHGEAVRITTGGVLPEGADAVLMEEFCSRKDNEILCYMAIGSSQNVLKRGADISKGELVLGKGTLLSPPCMGLLAAAGIETIPVYRPPRVAVITTGDEVTLPGKELPAGKLYASNMVEISSWLNKYDFPFFTAQVMDYKEDIEAAIKKFIPMVDAFISIGGTWGSERDLVLQTLDNLGWQGIYHKVRMSPGKGSGFGLLGDKPFFMLPGNPSSNEVSFLELALTGLMKMRGIGHPIFPVLKARLGKGIRSNKDWTGFIHADLIINKGEIQEAIPLGKGSRLKSMAGKKALIIIPEGKIESTEGDEVYVQVLDCSALNPGDINYMNGGQSYRKINKINIKNKK